MAYQNHKHHHNTYPYNWYEINVLEQPAAHPKHHHQKDRVAFRTEYETTCMTENIGAVRQGPRFSYQNADEDVNEEAEAFIQHEHKRMELARLMSKMNDV